MPSYNWATRRNAKSPQWAYDARGNLYISNKKEPTPQEIASVRTAVTDLVGMRGELIKNKGIVEAQGAAVKGAKAEIEAYTTAGGIATENARLVEEAGKIQQLQQERALNMSLGTTRADLAGAGLSASGSALDILKSSVRQGYLQQQITATQTALTSNAYLEQSVASKAQVAGATAQLEAAQAYGKTAGEMVKTTETNIDAETKALLGFMGTNPDLAASPAGQLATAQLESFSGTNPEEGSPLDMLLQTRNRRERTGFEGTPAIPGLIPIL